MNTRTQQSHHGFTLIETIVAVGIFSIVMLVLMGLFSRFTIVERRDIAEQKLLEEVRFGVELFSREARTAYSSTYSLPNGSGSEILFRNQNGLCVHYRLQGTQLERAERDTAGGTCSLAQFSGGAYASVTGPNTILEKFQFDVVPADVVDGELANQGFITVNLEARSTNASVGLLRAQTTVTSRQVVPYTGNLE